MLIPEDKVVKNQFESANAELAEVIDAYGFADSGVFAASLARAYGLSIVVILYQGFPLHVYCEAEKGYVDAYGVRSPESVCGPYFAAYGRKKSEKSNVVDKNALRFLRVSEAILRLQYTKHTEQDIIDADKYRLIFAAKVGEQLLRPVKSMVAA